MTFTVTMSWPELKNKVEVGGIFYSECSEGIIVYSPTHVPTTRGLFPIVYYAFIRDTTEIADFKAYVDQFPNKCTKGDTVVP